MKTYIKVSKKHKTRAVGEYAAMGKSDLIPLDTPPTLKSSTVSVDGPRKIPPD